RQTADDKGRCGDERDATPGWDESHETPLHRGDGTGCNAACYRVMFALTTYVHVNTAVFTLSLGRAAALTSLAKDRRR
ncbi:MAG TPA: hypothetical protein PKA68_08525, partial [Arachnia sp.]|nr:hypothetical protein [Arachnia sp.]